VEASGRRSNKQRECRTDCDERMVATLAPCKVATRVAFYELGGSTGWWVVAGLLVAVELSGTFYLLMLALSARRRVPWPHTWAPASTRKSWWRRCWAEGRYRAMALPAHSRRARPWPGQPDVNLDIGQTVHVDTWGADGTARVMYRGASWAVTFGGADAPAPGVHTIVAVQGSRLVVAPRVAR
jgi:membrane protein implicated in regulation of membrane protease activity